MAFIAKYLAFAVKIRTYSGLSVPAKNLSVNKIWEGVGSLFEFKLKLDPLLQ
jgi:hypothetical protein